MGDVASRVSILESQLPDLQDQAQTAGLLRDQCRELQTRIDTISDLKERRSQLESAIKDIEAAEAEMTAREHELDSCIARLKSRQPWVTLSEIHQQIDDAQTELDELSRQLGERRSRLSKLFGKKREG